MFRLHGVLTPPEIRTRGKSVAHVRGALKGANH